MENDVDIPHEIVRELGTDPALSVDDTEEFETARELNDADRFDGED